ncbi:MAG: hypothetical protein JW982_10350 [Spirochaetes bacterium]|nr:hypothetical protein [Spirochaetota bacterium]
MKSYSMESDSYFIKGSNLFSSENTFNLTIRNYILHTDSYVDLIQKIRIKFRVDRGWKVITICPEESRYEASFKKNYPGTGSDIFRNTFLKNNPAVIKFNSVFETVETNTDELADKYKTEYTAYLSENVTNKKLILYPWVAEESVIIEYLSQDLTAALLIPTIANRKLNKGNNVFTSSMSGNKLVQNIELAEEKDILITEDSVIKDKNDRIVSKLSGETRLSAGKMQLIKTRFLVKMRDLKTDEFFNYKEYIVE